MSELKYGGMFHDKTGKKSSKRILGFTGFVLGLGLFLCSGFHWYEIDLAHVLTLLGICAGMLAIGGLSDKG